MTSTLNESPLLITEAECARLLHCSEKTLARMRKAKTIPFVPMGRAIRYSRTAIEQFIADTQIQPTDTETTNGHE